MGRRLRPFGTARLKEGEGERMTPFMLHGNTRSSVPAELAGEPWLGELKARVPNR